MLLNSRSLAALHSSSIVPRSAGVPGRSCSAHCDGWTPLRAVGRTYWWTPTRRWMSTAVWRYDRPVDGLQCDIIHAYTLKTFRAYIICTHEPMTVLMYSDTLIVFIRQLFRQKTATRGGVPSTSISVSYRICQNLTGYSDRCWRSGPLETLDRHAPDRGSSIFIFSRIVCYPRRR